MAADWRRSCFGDRLVRSAAAAEDPLDLCPVDVLIPKEEKPPEEMSVVAVYFRSFVDPSAERPEDTVTKALDDLQAGLGPRLQVVQVFVPPWVGQLQNAEQELDRLFRHSYVGVPWLTMPIADHIKWVRLRHRFRGQVGMLVLLCAHSGKVLLGDASCRLLEDPQGLNFPWLPRPTGQLMCEATQKGLIAGGLRKGPKIVPYSNLEGYIKGLYFSAHWCPPCKAFTPQLVEFYHRIRSQGHKFEVIFISSDRSEESYENYLATMPWTALPFKSSFSKELAKNLEVYGIPSLVLLDSDNSLITDRGRSKVEEDLEGEFFPWRWKLVNILSESHLWQLYNAPALVLFVDGDEDQDLEFAEAVLQPVAEWAATLTPALDYEIFFYVALESDASERLRVFTDLDDASPLVTIIDVPLNRLSVMEYGAEITEESVKTFVSNFVSDKLTFRPISDCENSSSINQQ